jgi:hypothetical protein
MIQKDQLQAELQCVNEIIGNLERLSKLEVHQFEGKVFNKRFSDYIGFHVEQSKHTDKCLSLKMCCNDCFVTKPPDKNGVSIAVYAQNYRICTIIFDYEPETKRLEMGKFKEAVNSALEIYRDVQNMYCRTINNYDELMQKLEGKIKELRQTMILYSVPMRQNFREMLKYL